MATVLAQYELLHTGTATVATALPAENVTEDQQRLRPVVSDQCSVPS